ncbi:MAG: DNA polymerase III subunit alpha, partial [Clostridia bacterium]|nr:DNA polymerase III subunit alpha [Clostridia bacterium]
IIEYVKEKYSPSHVAQIITFGTMAAKNAIRDVARVLKVPYSEADKISKLVPAKLPAGIKKPPVLKYYFGTTGKEENDKFIIPELRELYDSDETIKHVIDLAIKLEGMPRNTSTHACGVLIVPDDVQNFVPLSRNGEDISTQYTMTELESLGLLKMDFLGLKTLTDIRKACQYVKEQTGEEIDFYDMSYDDPKVYELISSGNTEAIFQLESGGFKKFLKELKPDCLEDIIAGVSLYRPGPMDSIPRYIKNKHNPKEIEYADPCLEPILKATYGCIVYQEQVMKVFQVMGGFNMGQADNVRRIMGKKKVDKMPYEKQKFIHGWEDPEGKKSIPGAIKLGISEQVAEQVFGEMESFAQYAFNKSHAAAYAYLTYQTAYLKTYHEVELICAVLNNRITNSDEVKNYITYAKSENIEVLPPDINKSETYFKVENGNLRYGLSALKNVGIGVIEGIIEEREKNGDFKDFLDFMKRVDSTAHNKKCLEGLIISGAFDGFNVNRSQLMAVYDLVVDRIARDRKN